MKTQATIRLTLLANRAAPSPILGQALGQYGINIMDFCKKFNEKTKNVRQDVLIPTKIKIFSPTNFQIDVHVPTTTYLLKKTGNFIKGSSYTKKQNLKNHYITLKEIYHIALFKRCDTTMSYLGLQSVCKSILGSAKSIGIPVINSFEQIL